MTLERMTTAEAERYCGSGKGYFRVLRWAGKGPVYYRQQSRIYYLLSDLDSYLAKRNAAIRVDPTTSRAMSGDYPALNRPTPKLSEFQGTT